MKVTLSKPCVVVPWDFSKLSLEALRQTVEMVGNVAAIQVVHVSYVPSPYEYGMAWEGVSESIMAKRMDDSFREFINELPHASDYQFTVEFGDPGRKICEFAKEVDAEMIVMPSHGHSGFSRLLLGSVAERVVRFADCPVLVLRLQNSESENES